MHEARCAGDGRRPTILGYPSDSDDLKSYDFHIVILKLLVCIKCIQNFLSYFVFINKVLNRIFINFDLSNFVFSDCPENWVLFETHCYQFNVYPYRNYVDAKAACGVGNCYFSIPLYHLFSMLRKKS